MHGSSLLFFLAVFVTSHFGDAEAASKPYTLLLKSDLARAMGPCDSPQSSGQPSTILATIILQGSPIAQGTASCTVPDAPKKKQQYLRRRPEGLAELDPGVQQAKRKLLFD
mmetsp:Transcript_27001/g.54334  ORF Transcript_27001/g.54334 Transcript_27001/m.54334 type:complete len:111 (-) Transcript_27001:410-742(-)